MHIYIKLECYLCMCHYSWVSTDKDKGKWVTTTKEKSLIATNTGETLSYVIEIR